MNASLKGIRNLFSRKFQKHEINGVTYKIDTETSTAEVTRSPNAAGDVVILSEIHGKTITKIGNAAFHGCKDLISVKIPNTVTSIGFNAFSGCKELTNVTIPQRTTSIVCGAFSDCPSLKNISKFTE